MSRRENIRLILVRIVGCAAKMCQDFRALLYRFAGLRTNSNGPARLAALLSCADKIDTRMFQAPDESGESLLMFFDPPIRYLDRVRSID
jgi:hypothetical protein